MNWTTELPTEPGRYLTATRNGGFNVVIVEELEGMEGVVVLEGRQTGYPLRVNDYGSVYNITHWCRVVLPEATK